jgi:hypothetical protein
MLSILAPPHNRLSLSTPRASWNATGQVVARSLIQAAGKFYDAPVNVMVSQPARQAR